MEDSIRYFGQQLAYLRRNAHLSQEELAEKSGLSRNYIGLLECGRRQPSLLTVLQIQHALGVGIRDLVPHAVSKRMLAVQSVPTASHSSPEYEKLIYRLKKCSSEEISAVSKIVKQVLKLTHHHTKPSISSSEV